MPACFHCKRESSAAHHDRVVYNKTYLHGPWTGWRMAGNVLVSPDRDRITPERLRGILWRESLQKRVCRSAVPALVVALPSVDRYEHGQTEPVKRSP